MKVKYSCSIDAILLPSRTIDIKSHSILRVPPILRMWESFSYGLWIFLLSVILIAIEFVYFGQYLKIKCYYLISLLFIVKFYYVIMNWEVRLDLWLTRDFSGSWWWSWWWHEALQALNWFLLLSLALEALCKLHPLLILLPRLCLSPMAHLTFMSLLINYNLYYYNLPIFFCHSFIPATCYGGRTGSIRANNLFVMTGEATWIVVQLAKRLLWNDGERG